MVLQPIDKKETSFFICDWCENVEKRDYFTGLVPLSSDKSQSLKDLFVLWQSGVGSYDKFFWFGLMVLANTRKTAINIIIVGSVQEID